MNNQRFLTTECLMTRTMAMIGTKWKPILIYTIGEDRLRFGALATRVSLISRKVLTEQLKELEEDGILKREAFNEIPPRVEYYLTQKGRDLLPILQEMCNWSKQYTGEAEGKT